MQKTMVITGTVSKDLGVTISEKVNKILENRPNCTLELVNEIRRTDCTVTLFCVFRKNSDDNKNTLND